MVENNVMKKQLITALAVILLSGCASAPTYTVLTNEGTEYTASTEPMADAGGYLTFLDEDGKKVRIKEADVKSISED